MDNITSWLIVANHALYLSSDRYLKFELNYNSTKLFRGFKSLRTKF